MKRVLNLKQSNGEVRLPRIVLSVGSMTTAFEKLQRRLSQRAEVVVTGLGDYSLKDVDIFIGKKMDKRKLEEENRLCAVFAYKTGVDDFPLTELGKRGIWLFNSHANSEYIAQYAFVLATALAGRIVEFDRRMRKGDWAVSDPYWRSIQSMKIGLVGYGHIGKEVHRIMKRNGVECFTLDRGKEYKDIATVKTLDELCEACDMLILSLPKTPETDGMFNERVFNLLKEKYIVNVGRGNCIDETALYSALKSKTLAGAAIDTWRSKPKRGEKHIPFTVPLDELDNLILSSHKAMQLSDGHDKYVADILWGVTEFLNGVIPDSVVDCREGY